MTASGQDTHAIILNDLNSINLIKQSEIMASFSHKKEQKFYLHQATTFILVRLVAVVSLFFTLITHLHCR